MALRKSGKPKNTERLDDHEDKSGSAMEHGKTVQPAIWVGAIEPSDEFGWRLYSEAARG